MAHKSTSELIPLLENDVKTAIFLKRRHPVDLPDLERMVLTIRNTVGDPDHKPTMGKTSHEKQGIQRTNDGI